MIQLTWYRKLKALNARLDVCQFENSSHLPGLYYRQPNGELLDICATDVGAVPAMPVYNSAGYLTKSGYRRVISMLLALKLVTKDKVKKIMGNGYFEHHYPEASRLQLVSTHQRWMEMMRDDRKHRQILGDAQKVDVQDKIVDKMKEMEIDNFNRRGQAALSGDQFLELAEDVKKDQPDYKRENLDRAKFEYEKAVGKRKTII